MTCAPLQGIVHERNLRAGSRDAFPDAVDRLLPTATAGLSRCPSCGRWYRTTTHTEWDMFEEVLVETGKIFEVTEAQALYLQGPAGGAVPRAWATMEKPGRCPKCGGENLTFLRGTKVGEIILEWCRCNACGHEAFMDQRREEGGQG